MASGITFDMRTFEAGLRAKLKASKKALAAILNQAGGSICANAIRLTKGAEKSVIKNELTRNGLALRLVQSRRFAARLLRALQGFPGGRHTRAEINAAAAKLVQMRLSSVRYITAGWFKALAVFRPNSQRKVSSKGLAGRGRATKATERKLVATFENHSRGAAAVGAVPLQKALDDEGRSMLAYAAKKLADALK